MEIPLLKALAGKHRSTVSAMARKYTGAAGDAAGDRGAPDRIAAQPAALLRCYLAANLRGVARQLRRGVCGCTRPSREGSAHRLQEGHWTDPWTGPRSHAVDVFAIGVLVVGRGIRGPGFGAVALGEPEAVKSPNFRAVLCLLNSGLTGRCPCAKFQGIEEVSVFANIMIGR
jgi:hypothetical protein